MSKKFEELYTPTLFDSNLPLDEGVWSFLSNSVQGVLQFYLERMKMESVWELAVWVSKQKNPPEDLVKALIISVVVAGGNELKRQIKKIDREVGEADEEMYPVGRRHRSDLTRGREKRTDIYHHTDTPTPASMADDDTLDDIFSSKEKNRVRTRTKQREKRTKERVEKVSQETAKPDKAKGKNPQTAKPNKK